MELVWRDWSSGGALCPVTSQCGDDLRPLDILDPSRVADLYKGTSHDGTSPHVLDKQQSCDLQED